MATVAEMTRITLFIVYLLSIFSDGFRIRRSGLAGFNDPYALSNAYSDLTNRRRRTELGPLVMDDDDSYFNPNSLNDLEDNDSFFMGSPYLDEAESIPKYLQGYRIQSPYTSFRNKQEYPFSYGDLEEPVYTQQKRMSHKSHAFKRMGQSSIKELQRIFASADVPEKKLAPVKRREPVIRKKSEQSGSKMKETKNLVQKVREILAAAEKITREETKQGKELGLEPEVVEDAVVEKVSPDGSTEEKKELVTVTETNNDETPDENESNIDKNVAKEGDIDEVESSNEGEIVEKTKAGTFQSKSKRASIKYNSEEYVRDLEDEITNLRDEVVRLQLLQILEDKENDFLANALKLATLDQLNNDDRLVAGEYEDISKATDTEELIQQITNEGEDADLVSDAAQKLEEYLEADINNEEEDDAMIKRADLIPDKDGWLETPVQESISYGPPIDENVADDMQGSEFPIAVPYPDEDDDDTEAVDEDDEDDENAQEALAEVAEEVKEEIEEETENEEKKQVLQELLKGLDKEEIEDLIAELKEVNERKDEALDGVCLPVIELSQNCAFADSLRIPIDEEARSLCSRHQMCYTCGAAHGITRIGCNDGYKGTVIESCRDDNNCIGESAIFLRLMEKYHMYEDDSPDECSAPCVEDFIIGGE